MDNIYWDNGETQNVSIHPFRKVRVLSYASHSVRQLVVFLSTGISV